MSVRAKFVVQGYDTSLQRGLKETPREDGKARNWNNSEDCEQVECRTIRLTPVADGSEENKKFFRYTPSGKIEIGTLNPAAWEQFEIGREYYVDFSPAQ